MTTLATAKKVAAKYGATLVDDKVGNTHECRCEAPHRHIWKCSDLHELISSAYRPWKPDYADIIDRMEYGIEPCTDPDCEWCCDEIS